MNLNSSFFLKRGTITMYMFLNKYIFNYKNISNASVYILDIFSQKQDFKKFTVINF